jgi:uncharacterized protein YhbP (UPF0306 family)
MSNDELARAQDLVTTGRYLSLATVGTDGDPWCCNINYVVEDWLPLSLVYYSARTSKHSLDIAKRPTVAGTIYKLDPSLDGAQFIGTVAEVVDDDDVVRVHDLYYTRNFPDPQVRADWEIRLTGFGGTNEHRFYRMTISKLWVINLADWPKDKVDRRTEVDLADLGT